MSEVEAAYRARLRYIWARLAEREADLWYGALDVAYQKAAQELGVAAALRVWDEEVVAADK